MANDEISELAEKLKDPWWRLNSLYYIVNRRGKKIRFGLNCAQKKFYADMWYLNIILKARQLGFTTFIDIFMLDRALFNDNTSCGIIAHTKDDVKKIFDTKIRFVYDSLPSVIKNMIPAKQDSANQLSFQNGSSISVATSLRSGSYQYAHISEFGKICAQYPKKAEEIIAGTLNAVVAGQFVFVESTAEGPFGKFCEMVNVARKLADMIEVKEAELTEMDYRFFFFPWWQHPDYVLNKNVPITKERREYFKHLADDHNIKLSDGQKAWYSKKSDEQGDLMKQEFPSTPDEAFERVTNLMIFGKALQKVRKNKQITTLPIVPGIPVNTFWDLGRNDLMAIWFHQHIKPRHHFIYYYEDRLKDLGYYADVLADLRDEFGWRYGDHYFPHDVETTDLSVKVPRREILEDAGVRPIVVVPKVADLMQGIEATRRMLSECWFDSKRCKEGIEHLYAYQWKYDETHKIPLSIPVRNNARNAADALRQFAQGYHSAGSFKSQFNERTGGGGGRTYARNREGKNNGPINPSYDHIL